MTDYLWTFQAKDHQAPDGAVHTDALASVMATHIEAHDGPVQLKSHLKTGPMRPQFLAERWFPGRIQDEASKGISEWTLHWKRYPDALTTIMAKKDPSGVSLGFTWLQAHAGTPYVFGGTDCSWASQQFVLQVTRGKIMLPHYSGAQFTGSQLVAVARDNIQRGDLSFYGAAGRDHVAIIDTPGWVWDEEPGTETAPSGGVIHGGLYRRPTAPGYYAGLDRAVGFRRIPG